MSEKLVEYKSKLDALDVEEPSKSRGESGIVSNVLKKLIGEYRIYTMIFIIVLIFLIMNKPNFIKDKNQEGIPVKVNIQKLLKTWLIISVSISIAYYIYIRRGSKSESCKVCGK